MDTTIETMSVAEAVMRMDLAELPALMFRSGAHGGLNMIYRRPDGHGRPDRYERRQAAESEVQVVFSMIQ